MEQTPPLSSSRRVGMLLAAFGSGVPAAQRSLEGFEAEARRAFPGVSTRWAFTSGRLRSRLAGEGVKIDSVRKALEKFLFERFTHIAVQSLHVVPGREYAALAETVAEVGAARPEVRLALGKPLLADEAGVRETALAIARSLPPERMPGDVVLCMGHGTSHEADARYDALALALREAAPGVLLGSMDGARSVEAMLEELRAWPGARVWLMPLLFVAGAHVLRDMAGEGPDSWRSRIQAAGHAVAPVLTGAVEHPALAALWLRRLAEAMADLERAD